jgi:2-keto-4-pentenoate hydratase/2-oxohepta-3-ene-1,7-dioic acid hydratase in catechol pathway
MIIRFKHGEEVAEGSLKRGVVQSNAGTFYLEEVTLLPPVAPGKVICVGLNYAEHARELQMEQPREPIIFLKPSTAIVGPNAEIVHPPSSLQVDYEGELAIVMLDRCKDVKAMDAASHILGFTCFNDVTARDLQKKDGQWTRAKSFDTFAPLGPGIVEERELSLSRAGDLGITTKVNGVVRQSSRTSDLIFGLARLVEFISEIMTLMPGDVIATGTPPGVGKLNRGDLVEVEIEGIGILANRVV